MKLSEHFSLQEFLRSATAKKYNVRNEATEEHFKNMKALCINVLEPLRTIFNKPIHITSGFRSHLLNKVMGENGYHVAKYSDHLYGRAADIYISGVTNEEIVKAILTHGIKFKQLIDETSTANKHTSKWIHVSYDRTNLKCQCFKMYNGKVVSK